ncbi:MAG: hypothetical protein IKU54_04020 [Oscillospiraceae bacterium]|nr:hypothetical protein [Oscillospiraceae bacterium]
MTNMTTTYAIELEGNDLDVKKVQKLKKGDSLMLKRINDAEDTYEICVCFADGKEIDMLSYAESIGVAPFMDSELITVEKAEVARVEVKPGKTRAKDKTTLQFNVTYAYDEEALARFTDTDMLAFHTEEDAVLCMAAFSVAAGESDVVMSRPYLNLYTMDMPMEYGWQYEMYDCEYEENTTYNFYAHALFNETFTKCKVMAKIYNPDNEEDEFVLELDENEKQTVVTLVNHARIFDGEDGVNCEIE